MTSLAGSKATLEDVARMAGVSLATVDRVVNRRVGVRERTIARVEAAVAKLGYRADAAATRLARNRSFRFAFILPTGANTFMTNLAEQVRRTADWLAGHRGFIDVLHVDVFDPDALAGALGASETSVTTATPRAGCTMSGSTIRRQAAPRRRSWAASCTAARARSGSSPARSPCATTRSGSSVSTRSCPANIPIW